MAGDPSADMRFHGSPQQVRRWLVDGEDAVYTVRVTMPHTFSAHELSEGLRYLTEAWAGLRMHLVLVPGLSEPLLAVPEPGAPSTVRAHCDGTTLTLSVPTSVADVASVGLLVAGLAEALEAGTVPPQEFDLLQHAEWQRSVLKDPEAEVARRRWRLEQCTPRDIPALLRDPEVAGSPAMLSRCEGDLGHVLAGRLQAVALRLGIHLEVVVSAVWAGVLSRWTGRTEVGFGRELSGRVFDEMIGAVGVFASFVPTSVAVSAGVTLRELVHQVDMVFARQSELEDFAPAAEAVTAPAASIGLTCIVDTPLPDGWQIEEVHRPFVPGVVWCTVSLPQSSGDTLKWTIDHDPELIDHFAVAAFSRSLALGLEGAVGDLDEPLDRRPLLLAGDPAVDPGPPPSSVTCDLVPVRFARRVAEHPERVAVRVCAASGNEELTYADLAARSCAAARQLRASAVGRGDTVGVASGRSVATLIWYLGAWSIGAVVVPLDQTDAPGRRERIVQDAAVVAVVDRAPDPDPMSSGGTSVVSVGETDPAYVIYTSGTTGSPKGVVVPHRELARYLNWAAEDLLDGSPLPTLSSPAFDASLKQLVAPILRGDFVLVIEDEIVLDPVRLLATLAQAKAISINCVPSFWDRLLQVADRRPNQLDLHRLMLGGEAVSQDLVSRTARCWPRAEILNVYGPTEATANATVGRLTVGSPVTIGRAVAGRRVYVLDRDLHLLPAGAPGRLFIGGDGLADGYLGDPSLTAERFRPDPAGWPGSRMYNTGDLGVRRPDGQVELRGRDDLQVKIRGHRVELEGVEAVMRTCPGVAAVAVGMKTEREGRTLCAWVVPIENFPLTVAQLREYSLDQLPEHAIPTMFFTVPALPRSASGKIDRFALETTEGTMAPMTDVAYGGSGSIPTTAIERRLAQIWAELLDLDDISRDQSFFSLGGHSLLVVRLIGRIREEFGVRLLAREVFTAPTVFGIAEMVERAWEKTSGYAKMAHPRPTLARASRTGPLPMSFAQRQFWLAQQISPNDRSSHVLGTRRLLRSPDPDLVLQVLRTMIARHEILRTSFRWSGRGEPHVHIEDMMVPPLSVIEVNDLGDLDDTVANLVARPIDIGRVPLWHLTVARTLDGGAILVLVAHHAITDASSKELFFAEMERLYMHLLDGTTSDSQAQEWQFLDFAADERSAASTARLEAGLAWWRNELQGMPRFDLSTLRLDTAHVTQSRQTAESRLPTAATATLSTLQKRTGGTAFMVVLAALVEVLSEFDGTEEVALGTVVSRRERPELDAVLGPFVNTVVLRVPTPPAVSLADRVGAVRDTLLRAQEHGDVPFDWVVKELAPRRSQKVNPLLSVFVMSVVRAPLPKNGAGTFLRTEIESGVAPYPVTVSLVSTGQDHTLHVSADDQLFEPGTAARLLRRTLGKLQHGHDQASRDSNA